MTVYSTQSSGRDARHALATPTFCRLKERHHSSTREHRTLDIKSSLFCLPPRPAPNARISGLAPVLQVLHGADALAALGAAKIKTTALPLREALRQR